MQTGSKGMPHGNAGATESGTGRESDRLELEAARRELASLRRQLDTAVAALDLRNAALDASTTHFMILDAREECPTIVYANKAMAAQHGFSDPGELIGQDVTAIVGSMALDESRHVRRKALLEGRASRMEAEIIRRDGTSFWAGFTTTSLRNASGEITHLVTLAADITARRTNEAQQHALQQQLVAQMQERERMATELQLAQKLESVGRLAAGLAHEINTPIQYVGDSIHFLQSAYVDLAMLIDAGRRELATPEQMNRLREREAACDLEFLTQEIPKAFERTLDGVERVTNLVRAMKEFAYPDGPEHMPADLDHAIATTLTVARNEYKYAATLTTDFGRLPLVMCNVGELNQVFLNLVVNAAHAVQDSGKDISTGRITIGTRTTGDMAEVRVSDNGCGIAAENLAKIFDPFFTTKEVGRGTGQGLAIARSIVVDRHGGQLEVQSVPGEGTTFIVRLPLCGKAAKSAA
jgi:PAS domain S-box-containing protein